MWPESGPRPQAVLHHLCSVLLLMSLTDTLQGKGPYLRPFPAAYTNYSESGDLSGTWGESGLVQWSTAPWTLPSPSPSCSLLTSVVQARQLYLSCRQENPAALLAVRLHVTLSPYVLWGL
ncbi:hypothetical protein FKM82_028942 [Ascaphus truei]